MTAPQWILWSVGLFACLALLGWALFWDRARGRQRCPKCWYDMSAAIGRRCPECGREWRRDRQLRRTHRHWRTAAAALLMAIVVAVAPFWKILLARGARYLPSTALILLDGRITFDQPSDAYLFDNELWDRLREGPNYCVSRWNREALWRWQWRLLADRDDVSMTQLHDVAEVFAQAPPAPPLVVTDEEMLALDHDATGKRMAALEDRLGLPHDTFLPEFADSLAVRSLDMKAVDGSPARIYLLSSMQRFAIVGLRSAGDQWVFAGLYVIHSKYADPDLTVLPDDDAICELGGISTGGTGVWQGLAAWCRIDERGLHFVHDWSTGASEAYGGGPYNFEMSNTSTTIGRDARGRFVDHAFVVTISNSWWQDDPRCDPADVAAVADLVDVFQRTGVARYRWNERKQRFVHSAAESDWTAYQVEGSAYNTGDDDDGQFITQNFDTLVSLATGDDPAKRAWVRLALTRLSDGAAKTRLQRAIKEHKKK